MGKYFIAFISAFTIAYLLTPYAKKLAYKVGAIDVPKDKRRVHKKPMPRLGGLAIYMAFLITTLILTPISRELIGILIGATMIVSIGMIDDVKQISAKYKLLVQILATLVVIYSGVRIEFITDFFNKDRDMLYLGLYSIPVTIFWVVGITNTVNLIDGLDGLAAGVSLIAAITMAFVSFIGGQYHVAMFLVILAGGILGFLPYNFNPAQIFMGDTGSLLIGFLLAVISVQGLIKSVTTIAVAIPVLALGVPILDTTFAIIRRLINKRPIMEADKGHLHHRLLDRGLTQRQTVLVLYFISVILGGSAILVSDATQINEYLILGTVISVIFVLALRMGLVKEAKQRKMNV